MRSRIVLRSRRISRTAMQDALCKGGTHSAQDDKGVVHAICIIYID